jgi:hypothetical protein
MIKMSHIATALLLASITVAHAETTKQPVAQGAASVDKNLSKDPDNKGLQNASEQLQDNKAKVADKRSEADKKADAAKQKRIKKIKRNTWKRLVMKKWTVLTRWSIRANNHHFYTNPGRLTAGFFIF